MDGRCGCRTAGGAENSIGFELLAMPPLLAYSWARRVVGDRELAGGEERERDGG